MCELLCKKIMQHIHIILCLMVAFTPMAVNAMICGLSDVNIYPNHQYESYKQVYATSFAPQIKKIRI